MLAFTVECGWLDTTTY